MSASEDLVSSEPTITKEVHSVDDEEDLHGGIQMDPIGHSSHIPGSILEGDDNKENVPQARSLTANTSGWLIDQSSVISDQEPRNGCNTSIVRMISVDSTTSNPSSTPKSPPSRRGTNQSRRKPSLFRRDSGLSLQDSWRKKAATVRVKSSNNFVSFHNVNYTVPQGYFWQHKPPKVILNNVRYM